MRELDSPLMAENGKPKSPKGDDAGVLASLPATRPSSLSRRGRAAQADASDDKPKAATRKAAAAKPKAAKAKPKAPAKPRPKAPSKPSLTPVPDPTPQPKPRAVRAGAPALKGVAPDSDEGRERARELDEQPADGHQLVSTVVQAAGELAQVGLTVGGQLIKRAVQRLPKP